MGAVHGNASARVAEDAKVYIASLPADASDDEIRRHLADMNDGGDVDVQKLKSSAQQADATRLREMVMEAKAEVIEAELGEAAPEREDSFVQVMQYFSGSGTARLTN